MVPRLLTLGVLLLGTGLFRGLDPDFAPLDSSATPLVVGLFLMAGVLAGQLARDVGLPRISGCLVLGVVAGPGVLGLVTPAELARLGLVDDVAICIIALGAGGELRLAELRHRRRVLLGVMGAEMVAVYATVAAALLLAAPWLPFAQGLSERQVHAMVLVFASIAVTNSPSVTMAVLQESKAHGPVASTVLAVTIAKDILVVFLFTGALSLAVSWLSPDGGNVPAALADMARRVGASVVVGAATGAGASLYLRRKAVHPTLFVLGTAAINVHLATAYHLELLVLALVSGFVARNLDPKAGRPFFASVQENALPFYTLFFAFAGAKINLGALASLWPFVLGLVALRGAAVWAGTRVGAWASGAEPAVGRYAWTGFISQAGVTLGMVTLAAREFPDWGDGVLALFLATVAVHELVGPALLQRGLERAGEVERRAS
ncbi:MAG: hypothetical protein AMXMBFR53_39960 [Gemmatimonadota bacterium]